MYKMKKGLAAFLAAATGLSSLALGTVSAVPVSATDTDSVKILSLGDSITDGYWTSGAYRKYMYHELEQMGYNIDMVGPKGSNSNTFTYNGETVTYDDNNAGYSGYAIQEMSTKEHRSGILETIQGTWYNGKNMIASYQPDIVLLQIGTNDILSEYNDGITDRLENLVNVILQDLDNDDVIYVSTIPDIDAILRSDWLGSYGINAWGSSDAEKQQLMETVTGCIDSYNTSIYNLVLQMQNEGKPVRFADINSVVDYQTDLYDGVHPNEAGYENMGKYWAGLLDGYFQETGMDKPVTTTAVTTTSTTTTTTTVTTATTAKPATTTQPITTKATTTTTTTKATIPSGASEIHLSDVTIGESYDLQAYSDVSAVSFVFSGNLQYGMNGCVAFGNWASYQNYTQDDMQSNVLTISLDQDYNSLTLYKWYGDVTLADVILYCGDTATTNPTTTTVKPTTTTTTTTTTAKPTTTTTTTTTAKPTTTTTTTTTTITTTTTTTTTKPTTTTTTTTITTTAKPTTTTTTITTTAKPTTTTTTATTTKLTTTTTEQTTVVTTPSSEKKVVLTDVVYGNSYSLAAYQPSAVKEIVLQLKGDVGYGFGGKLVLGGWTVQCDYSAADLKDDNTISFKITNPQDTFQIFNYWGNMELESVTLIY